MRPSGSYRQKRFRRLLFLAVVVCAVGYYPVRAVWAQPVTDPGVSIEDMDQPPDDGVAVDPESLPADEFFRARVLKLRQDSSEVFGVPQTVEFVTVRLLNGPHEGTEVEIEHNDSLAAQQNLAVHSGDTVLVLFHHSVDGSAYYIVDQWRLPRVLGLVGAFLLVVLWFGRGRGATAVIGLVVTLVVLVRGVVPLIVQGWNPLAVCLGGGVLITVVALYLAHGLKRRTSIAVVATLATLGLATGLAVLCVSLVQLTGLGSEEAIYLQLDALAKIDLRGLLLGGIIIGALGVLDDITTAQAAVVEELHHANPELPRHELYRRGLSVGREHIASLVNTLVLAYVGASFPLLLLFSLHGNRSAVEVANSEFLVEEIVRTLVGSTALIVAVPLTTALTAYWLTRPAESTPSSRATL